MLVVNNYAAAIVMKKNVNRNRDRDRDPFLCPSDNHPVTQIICYNIIVVLKVSKIYKKYIF